MSRIGPQERGESRTDFILHNTGQGMGQGTLIRKATRPGRYLDSRVAPNIRPTIDPPS